MKVSDHKVRNSVQHHDDSRSGVQGIATHEENEIRSSARQVLPKGVPQTIVK